MLGELLGESLVGRTESVSHVCLETCKYEFVD